MDCIKYLNSYDEIADLVRTIQFRRIKNPFIMEHYRGQVIMEHYRGQGRPEYKLLPSISRDLRSVTAVHEKEEKLISNLQKELSNHKLEKILRLDSQLTEKQNLWNIYLQAQHLGIPTRFLDRSLKWEVGLWFAVENSKNDDVDGQFWVFSVPDEIHCLDDRNRFYDKDILLLDKTYFINAPIYWSDKIFEQTGEIRRMRQHGKFSISPIHMSLIPLGEQCATIPYLEKYCIPAKIKGQLRLELVSRGIYQEWLYYRENMNELLEKIINEVSKSA